MNDAAKKNPLTMTLGEILKEFGPVTATQAQLPRKRSGTFQHTAEEPLPLPPASGVFSAKTFSAGGVQYLRVADMPYNHAFVRAFIPYRVAREGKTWKWDKTTKSWVVPVADLQLFCEALKECFKATSLSVDGRAVRL